MKANFSCQLKYYYIKDNKSNGLVSKHRKKQRQIIWHYLYVTKSRNFLKYSDNVNIINHLLF